MRKYSINIIYLTLLITAFLNNAYAASTNIHPKSLPVGNKPESVLKAFNDQLFVSVMEGNIKGDGKIIRITKDHEIKTFTTGLDQPKGMAFINNKLYVSDVDKVWEINASGEKKIFMGSNEFPSPALYLNDVDADKEANELYVTDMGDVSFMRDEQGKLWPKSSVEASKIPNKGRIYAISLSNKSVRIVLDFNADIRNPNGVTYNKDNGVLVTGFFSGKVVNIKNHNKTFLPGVFRGADQAMYDSKGNIYISSWSQGIIWKLDSKSFNSSIIRNDLKSAADFIFDDNEQTLIIPDMLNGTVEFISITH